MRITIIAVSACFAIGGCRQAESPPKTPIDIAGAGATFPYPLYRAWFSDYGARNAVRFNYFSVGSEEGMRLLANGEVDFGATDRSEPPAPRSARGCGVTAVPMVSGPVAIVYNLPAAGDRPLVLDANALARIFDGSIRRWNDRVIARLNVGRALPNLDIRVVHRGSGSGTSAAFSQFLVAAGVWKGKRTAQGDAVWPVGIAAEGNQGVAAEVKVTSGAIGYVELSYATLNRLSVASMQAADGVPYSVSDSAYPIIARTWLLIEPERLSPAKRVALISFIRWAHHDGGAQALTLGYHPLGSDTVARYDTVLDRIGDERCTTPAH